MLQKTPYITNKTERFSIERGCVIWVAKGFNLKTGSWCCGSNFNFVLLSKGFIANVLKCKALLFLK